MSSKTVHKTKTPAHLQKQQYFYFILVTYRHVDYELRQLTT